MYKFEIILKDDGTIYISLAGGYSVLPYHEFTFDGKFGEKTFNAKWLKIAAIPTEICIVYPTKQELSHLKLKDNFVPSDEMPDTISKEDYDDIDTYEKSKYDFCYEHVYIDIPEKHIPVSFELNKIASRATNWEFVSVPPNVSYYELTKIENHPDLLQDINCFYSPEEAYKQVRNAIKNRIDPRYAQITSDYDFCLTVSKVLNIPNPEKYEVNVNAGTKRKPKYETHYRRELKQTVYEIAPKPYNKYPVMKKITGVNMEDLSRNMNEYIETVLKEINAPLEFCSCCNGTGIQEVS